MAHTTAATTNGGPAPADVVPAVDRRRDQTGLLTRFVPSGLKSSALYRWFLRLTRVLQLVSSTASLAIFTSRLYKVRRLINTITTRRGVRAAYGAVEGILAAAVLYTLLATLMSLSLKGGGPRWLRWLWVLLDAAFVGGFIAVAVLTRPEGGMVGPGQCFGRRDDYDDAFTGGGGVDGGGGGDDDRDDTCDLPWGTFALAIASTVLHAITAAFHEVRHHFHERHHRYTKESEAGIVGNGATGVYGSGHGVTGGAHAVNGATNGYTNGATNGYTDGATAAPVSGAAMGHRI